MESLPTTSKGAKNLEMSFYLEMITHLRITVNVSVFFQFLKCVVACRALFPGCRRCEMVKIDYNNTKGILKTASIPRCISCDQGLFMYEIVPPFVDN